MAAGPSALASASITTSEQLVKALRVPQPPANGVSKIDIALEAWQSDSFFVPKKAELLSQWVLEHLCSALRSSSSTQTPGTPNKGKNKAKQQQQQQQVPTTAVELDLKAWQLLSNIITAQISTESDLSEAAKQSWLSHLANTQPALTLAGAFARQLNQDGSLTLDDREALLQAASTSLEKLLPPATSRTAATNIEAAADSIHAWLDFFGQPRSSVEEQKGHAILQSILSTWNTTLQYGSNAKRNHQHFCSSAIPSLLRALHTLNTRDDDAKDGSTQSSVLLDAVRQIAAESLFAEDVQRTLLQAGRQAEVTRTASWKDAKIAMSGVVAQLCGLLEDQQLTSAALSSLSTLTDLLFTKLGRSEALNSIASSSGTASGSVRDTQLSLIRKTMLSQWFFPLLPHLVTSAHDQVRQAERAAARRGLLQGIELHSLYVVGCDEVHEWQSLFRTLFDSTRHELRHIVTDTSPAAQVEKAEHFACLASLWRLEKSVVEDELTSIFALVAAQPVSKQALWLPEELPAPTLAALELFRAVAAIDVRFRTIPALVNTVLSSIPLATEFMGKAENVPTAMSLFTSQTFLAELTRLCRDSVTAMQVSDLVQRLTGLAQRLDTISQTDATPRASKKPRTSSASPVKTTQAQAEGATALIAQLHIAAQVLQSVQLSPTFRARSIAAAEELHNALILPCIDACLSSTRTAQTYGVAAAALRVRQALLSEKWRYDPSEPVKLDGSLPTESLTCLEAAFNERADSLIELLSLDADGAELYQLQFQIVQSVLQRAERDTFLEVKDSRYCRLIAEDAGAIRDLLQELPSTSSAGGSAWNGCPRRVRDRGELMQVLWMAIVTRWASLFEAIAATHTIEVLASTVVGTAQPSVREDDVQSGMRYITGTALRNASFLELPTWRKHIVAAVQRQLASQQNLERRLASTAALCITPAEWVSKSARGPVLKALLTLDAGLVARHKGTGIAVEQWIELRSLIARVLEEYATETDVSDEDLFGALQAFWSSQEAAQQQSWERASLAAIHSAVRVLLARSKQNPTTLQRLFAMTKELRQEAAAESVADKTRVTLKMRAAQEMSAALSNSSEAVQQDGAGVAVENVKAILDVASGQLETVSDVAQALDIALYHLREVRLLVGGAGVDGVARQEISQVLSRQAVRSLCLLFGRADLLTAAMAEGGARQKIVRPAADVALELVRCIDACGGEGGCVLAACLAYSALIASLPGVQEQRRVADGLQRIVSRLASEAYDDLLTKLLTTLRSTASASIAVDAVDAKEAAARDGDAAALISTVGLVLGSAPEGTSKIARTHLSHWLAMLSSNPLTSGGRIKLRSMVACTAALDALCSHHAMLLRTQDMGAVLQLFSSVAGPSMADEALATVVETPRAELDAARTRVLDGVLSTLGSVMRLRQDVVMGVLPQLAFLLARLCTLFRRLKRHPRTGTIDASGTQRRELRRELPAWLDPVHVTPLDAARAARALSRLLSALVAKNVSLKHRSSDQPAAAKAESLARPFSKHSTLVLVAYLRSLTAPHAVVPVDVRAELDVGMLTLCELMGHHQRDAAMAGLLDSAGRVLLKRMWGEYEKQRYRGQ
ncbi:conserved hypothetical protein [Sporisorium reilianum SRZ2]|uniref:Nucleolar 27S pre-rRNA processing Urb2/Npa2 C-terminal domain-containing protein n=1 Tax=Sporisorium reilianum (strain SRZ2) TaxID=999809 RepID=E7A1H6_SPORE|nr:conserved hypothetical protein [Sporisorium reilianum SRZ2]